MKNLHSIMMLLALMVTAYGFTACSDDDDKGSVDASIVGRWELIADDVDPEEAVEQGVVVPRVELGTIIEFKSNGRYSEDGDESGSWKTDGNRLYVTSDDLPVPVEHTILQLNDTTLKFEMKVTVYLYDERTEGLKETKVTIQWTCKRIS